MTEIERLQWMHARIQQIDESIEGLNALIRNAVVLPLYERAVAVCEYERTIRVLAGQKARLVALTKSVLSPSMS